MGGGTTMAIKDWNFIKVKNSIDVSSYAEDPPSWKKQCLQYYRSGESIEVPAETKVIRGNTFSRYNYPKLRPILFHFKKFLEELLEEPLFETYCFDRFYFPGSMMLPHKDRASCEISVSLNISSTTEVDYPLWIKNDDEDIPIVTNPGDAVIYKGMDLPHWRDILVGDSVTYHHQAFFHYVRADGYYVEHAWDAAR